MVDEKTHNAHANDASPPRMYSPTLQPLFQSLLTTLANLDFEYQRERDRLGSEPQNGELKVRMLRKLADQHRERRGPYVEQLSRLQERMRHAAI